MSATEGRVTLAREYLASVRQHKVTTLPPSVLVRECAELRRQLGQVLDAEDGLVLTADQRDLIRAALDEAAEARTERVTAWCNGCATAPDDCCPEHAVDLDQADEYRQLRQELETGL